ncbi:MULTISPECIES: PIN domain-containing protein [unclassified Frankia]|uniref:PIN domain-containing protein n=1 Tax=unclassified Frankia TaxID=2632575 RepID=UPI002AD393EF|nr:MULTISPECIES: PIN domain-containing protein [unclassified Frankia]
MAGSRVVRTIVYDTGALLAAERRNPDFLALHDELTAARIRPIVPVVVLAQAWRGGPQHQVSRVLKGCDIRPDDTSTGRAAGVACGAGGTADVVDAIVVATAVRYQASVVTSDPDDLNHLADSIGVKLRLFTV